ncbi:MAG: mannosyl-3-phosphoglycerate synthase [Anaerolineales bacterium]|nr:mannosyl-3-phosphoglycerate synthase [Anaerolineales bacterium]
MRIEIPRESERFGAVSIHSVQKVLELDAGLQFQQNEAQTSQIIRRISYQQLHGIEKEMAVVVPMRGERIKLVQGVLCGIPNHCLVIIMSNSSRHPVDRFAIERDAFLRFSRFTDKRVVVVHQKDPALAAAFAAVGYEQILDPNTGLVRSGKAEGMIAATMLARLLQRKYIGFVDADNYFPGAVLEYVHEYAAGFALSNSTYAMTRIAWHSKPKIIEDGLFFAKWGRTSRNTNLLINQLLAEYTGFETEIIKTGNAGEHALTMNLALKLRYSSGYSIEPYHYINLFEQFGGLEGTVLSKDLILQHVDVHQIESRNPHMHDTGKGDEHIDEMKYAAMQVIYQSPICPKKLKRQLRKEIREMEEMEQVYAPVRYYDPLAELDDGAFRAALVERPYAEFFPPQPHLHVVPSPMLVDVEETAVLPPTPEAPLPTNGKP